MRIFLTPLILFLMVMTAMAATSAHAQSDPAIAQTYRDWLTRDIGHEASGRGGAVAAGDPRAVAAGIAILQHNGNAADAAAAIILTQTITDFGLFASGGEIPLMTYNAQRGQVEVLSGLGAAPQSDEAMAWYAQHGIPSGGDIKAAPPPAAISLVLTTLSRHGTMSLQQVAAPALVQLSEHHEPWHAGLARTLERLIEAERSATGTRQQKLAAAHERFYKGDIAQNLADFYEQQGGFLTREDLAAHTTHTEQPISINYRGYEVLKCDSWTQGPWLLQALRMLAHDDLPALAHNSADHIHLIIETMKLALADRDEHLGDPRFADVPLAQLLSPEYAALRRGLVDMDRASHERRPGDPVRMRALKGAGTADPGPGGTTTCLVADQWGNVVSATPSCNGPYAIDESTGIVHGNRLRAFNTKAGHPNRIEPGKRPRITLSPTLVMRDNKPILAISVSGGDLQDQTALHVLLNHIHFGMTPLEAVTAPRVVTLQHENSFNPSEDRAPLLARVQTHALPDDVHDELVRRGHDLHIMPADRPLARPSILYIDPDTGIIHVAGDPNAGRHAAALP